MISLLFILFFPTCDGNLNFEEVNDPGVVYDPLFDVNQMLSAYTFQVIGDRSSNCIRDHPDLKTWTCNPPGSSIKFSFDASILGEAHFELWNLRW